MPTITAIRLPIDWSMFGWPEQANLGGIALGTDDPSWAWEPAPPAFSIHACEPFDGEPVDAFVIDHVVMLVPDLAGATKTFSNVGIEPRLRMTIGGRQAAFFRCGPVIEVVEAPVRQASIYGIALATESSLESVALEWRARGVTVGDIAPAAQPGRRIMTIHDVEAGLAIMSPDRAVDAPSSTAR